jgi:hypothetical protein
MIIPPFHGWMTGPPPPIEKRKKFSLSPKPKKGKKLAALIAYRAFFSACLIFLL